MKPVSFYSASQARELDHFIRVAFEDRRLEEEFKQLQVVGRVPQNGRIEIVLPSGFDFRQRRFRLMGLYLLWNTDFLCFLLEEELEKFISEEPNLFERACQRAALRSRSSFEEYFFRKFSENDYFGNFLPRVEKFLGLFSFRWRQPPRARRTVRRRGYPSSTRRQLRIPIDGRTSHDYTIKWPDSEAQRAEETCRLSERLLSLSIIIASKSP